MAEVFPTSRRAPSRRWIELIALYVLPPFLVLPLWVHLRDMIVGVMIAAVAIWYLHCRRHGIRFFGNPYRISAEPLPDWRPALRYLLIRFIVCAMLLTGLLLEFAPEHVLSFPRSRPDIWIMVMMLYPLLSVVVQEFPYRQLFFTRYAPLFPTRRAAFDANVLLFTWLHMPFIAMPWGELTVILSLIAGYFFADTYIRGKRFWLVWLEHALYGNFAFTIGLGRLFYYNVERLG